MNAYHKRFCAKCPNNNAVILYKLTIISERVIMVEDINDKCGEFQVGYHEDFADVLFDEFGGLQRLEAFHHGVAIVTMRGVV